MYIYLALYMHNYLLFILLAFATLCLCHHHSLWHMIFYVPLIINFETFFDNIYTYINICVGVYVCVTKVSLTQHVLINTNLYPKVAMVQLREVSNKKRQTATSRKLAIQIKTTNTLWI